jgi:hypothetical protein
MPVATSWRDILVLVESIKNDLKNIENHNNTLEEQLNKLGTTFRDEGIEIIRNHISKTRKQIEDTVPEFETVLKKMLEYAQLTRLAESAINN